MTKTSTKKPKVPKAPVQMYPVDFDGCAPPRQLWKPARFGLKNYQLPRNKKIVKGVLHLPGRGSISPKIIFLSNCVLEEEAQEGFTSKPGMLRGAAANLFLRCIRRLGFKDEDWYYTALCKYPCKNMKPSPQDIRWNEQILDDELKRLKPQIVVCMGKPAFDHLINVKFKLSEIQGGFFRSEKYDCLVFPMDTITTPLYKPEHLERFLVDLKELRREFQTLADGPVVKLSTDYTVIDTTEKLVNVMDDVKARLDQGMMHSMAVDCEWHGQTAWSGTLRSLQMSWKPGQAAYIRFTAPKDGKPEYVMDQPLPVIRPILEPLRDARLKFVGHNIAADGVWMEEHLEIPMFQRVAFDTMFAQHCLNEYSDLKLERNAVKYTDLGRYDIPLLLWKKENKVVGDVEEGYGLIPDPIIIPYASKDVDTTYRIWPQLLKQLRQQQLIEYYFSVCLPFVTDGFMEMMRTGLPMDREYLEKMRTTFVRNRELLCVDFRKSLYKEACAYLSNYLEGVEKEQGGNLFLDLYEAMREGKTDSLEQLFGEFKDFVGAKGLSTGLPVYEHWRDALQFNVDSPDQLRRWLFDVKGFEPIKTTKRDGIQMAWEKVKQLPSDRQSNFTPAADKQTIKVLSSKDPLVARVEELKSVGNIVKAFLNEPDPETKKEEGLFKWIQPDGSVHPNFSLTETARPRTWKPNVLNWPKAISVPIERSFTRLNKRLALAKFKEVRFLGWPTSEVRKVVAEQMTKPTSVRSGVKAPEGQIIIDKDLKTAEVVALAYVSGDPNMIKVLTEDDKQFARIDAKDPDKVIRIAFNDNSSYTQDQWDDKLVFPESDSRIIYGPDNKPLHPKRDVHWELGEKVYNKPREKCNKIMTRTGVGKVGNFCIAEGELVLTDRGWIPIEKVLDYDSVWDGVDWVQHDGVKYNGEHTVFYYEGLWATPNHEVWDEDGRKIPFGEAIASGIHLRRITSSCCEDQYSWNKGISRNCPQARRWLFYGNDSVREMRREAGERLAQYGEGLFVEVPVPECQVFLPQSICSHAGMPLFSDEATVREGQQRTLLQDQSAIGYPAGESSESQAPGVARYRNSQAVFETSPRSEVYSEDMSWADAVRHTGRRDCIQVFAQHSCGPTGLESKINKTPISRVCKVYDIINAGPRHRYVCSGVLVSNSVPYGGREANLDRLVEANTGRKPPEGTGALILQAYQERYPVAWEFLLQMERAVEYPGWYRSVSGRVRHFFYNNLSDVEGLSDYAKGGILSPLTRQARNYPIQELVAATTAKALIRFLKERKERGLRSQVMSLLYDALSLLAPLEEAKEASELMHNCMTIWTPWTIADRTFNFDADTSYNLRWGVKMTKKEKEGLAQYLS